MVVTQIFALMWVIIIVKFYCGGNFGEMQFELPLQLDTARYAAKKLIFNKKRLFIIFCKIK